MRQAAKTRDQFHYFLPIQTRWSDNDLYGHVNNVTYYSYFDTAANALLSEEFPILEIVTPTSIISG